GRELCQALEEVVRYVDDAVRLLFWMNQVPSAVLDYWLPFRQRQKADVALGEEHVAHNLPQPLAHMYIYSRAGLRGRQLTRTPRKASIMEASQPVACAAGPRSFISVPMPFA